MQSRPVREPAVKGTSVCFQLVAKKRTNPGKATVDPTASKNTEILTDTAAAKLHSFTRRNVIHWRGNGKLKGKKSSLTGIIVMHVSEMRYTWK